MQPGWVLTSWMIRLAPQVRRQAPTSRRIKVMLEMVKVNPRREARMQRTPSVRKGSAAQNPSPVSGLGEVKPSSAVPAEKVGVEEVSF